MANKPEGAEKKSYPNVGTLVHCNEEGALGVLDVGRVVAYANADRTACVAYVNDSGTVSFTEVEPDSLTFLPL